MGGSQTRKAADYFTRRKWDPDKDPERFRRRMQGHFHDGGRKFRYNVWFDSDLATLHEIVRELELRGFGNVVVKGDGAPEGRAPRAVGFDATWKDWQGMLLTLDSFGIGEHARRTRQGELKRKGG